VPLKEFVLPTPSRSPIIPIAPTGAAVAIAEKVGRALVDEGYKTRVSHRDIGNE
jgi:hypothetical protein